MGFDMHEVIQNILDYIKGEIFANLTARYSDIRGSSRVYKLNIIRNPFDDKVTDGGSYKELFDSPILTITLIAIERLHHCNDCIMRVGNIISEFNGIYTRVRPERDDQAYKAIAIVYFVSLLQMWLHVHPTTQYYAELDAYYQQVSYDWAANFTEIVRLIYMQNLEPPYFGDENQLIEIIYEEVLDDMRMYGTYGIGTRSIVDQEISDIPF